MEYAVESLDSAPFANAPTSTSLNRKSKSFSKKGSQKTSFKYWKFGTINVRTLRTDAKAYEVTKSIDEAGLLIVGLQEVKRLDYGEVDIRAGVSAKIFETETRL